MATHSSILAWKIPWTEESGRLQSMESQDSDNLVTKPTLLLSSFESYVLQSVQAALRKKHRQGVLNNIKLFLTVLEYGESKIRVPLWFGSGASPLPDLLSLVLQKKMLWHFPFNMDTDPIRMPPPLSLNCFAKASHPNTITLGITDSASEFLGDINIQSIALCSGEKSPDSEQTDHKKYQCQKCQIC